MGSQLYRCWTRTARQKGAAVAVRLPSGKGSVSFEALLKRTELNLRDPSLARLNNRVVAIQLPNSDLWLEAFLSCQAVGAIAMPVDMDMPAEGLRILCSRLRPALIWTADGREGLPSPSHRKPACLVKLTSGSTGQPKPLFFEDSRMLADGNNILSSMGIRADDCNLAAIPLGHSYGLGNLVMPLVLKGIPMAIANDPFPHSLATAIAGSGATVFPAVPTLLRALVQSDVPTAQLATARLIISAGSPLSPRDASAFSQKFGKQIHNFYGSSETGGISYDRSGEDTLSGRSVGTPLDNVHIRPQAGGRLMVAGKAVHSRGNPRRWKGLPAWLLPDIGRLREDGSVVLLGRRSRMVKIGGKRLNLAEVESAILGVKAIDAAHVAAFTDDHNRTRLAAAFTGPVCIENLRTRLRELLPAWKIPAKWVRLEEFPTTGRGKPDVRKLEALLNRR